MARSLILLVVVGLLAVSFIDAKKGMIEIIHSPLLFFFAKTSLEQSSIYN